MLKLLHRPKFQIFSTESNMMVKVVWYLPKSEAEVHKCLQPFTEKRLFMSIPFTKFAGLLKKRSPPEMFSCECAFGWWLLLLNTIQFLCCVDLIIKMLLSTLALFWLSLNISRASTISCLLTAVSWSPRQLIDLLLIKQVIRPKYS